MARKGSREDIISNSLGDIPLSAIGNSLHIEMFGNKQLSFDGTFSILEYSEEKIKLKFKKGYLEIFGMNLNLNNVGDENLLITGKIISLEFAE